MWSGSKDKNYKEIKKYISNFDYYIEPFLGSGATFFNILEEKGIINATLADTNKQLINCFRCIKENPEYFNNLPKIKDKQTFLDYQIKLGDSSDSDAMKFLYLNRNRFFGMGGWMNADRYARNIVLERIKHFSPLMKNTILSNNCFDIKINKNSFIFCDPPYPETNNEACYSIKNNDVLELNIKYLEFLSKQKCAFLFITKYIPEIMETSKSLNLDYDIKKWTYRKPQQLPQEGLELYIHKNT
jgi:DNA adenine methylase